MDSTARPDAANGDGTLDDPVFVADLRRRMLRFATLQLSDPSLAEDAVQEAFVGALRGSDRFARRAAYRSWVFAILRHKIADQLRAQLRYASQPAVADDPDADPAVDQMFAASYARTLDEWGQRFDVAWDKIKGGKFDEQFRRLWLYYLGYCSAGFRTGKIDVGQFVLTKPA